MKSFLMIGQSNMAGRGNLDDVDPIVNDRCYMFRMGRWLPMQEPINIDSLLGVEYPSGVGLAASFADMYSKYFKEDVGLIPCAVGDTAIEQWMPGGYLYENTVFNARYAMKSSELSGILWHQGENNAELLDEEAYRIAFLQLMTAFRKDLGAERLPVVIGEISEKISPKWNIKNVAEMNLLLNRLSKELQYCSIAPASELDLKQDGVHFSAQSYRTLGIRYFESYLDIVKNFNQTN